MSSKMRKVLIVLLSLTLVALVVEAVILFFPKNGFTLAKPKRNVIMTFEDDTLLKKEINVNSEKIELDKVNVLIDGIVYDGEVLCDKETVKLDKIGTYILKYYIIYEDDRYELEQTIVVVDKEAPVIKLNGGNIVILVGEEYKEPGYEVTDNYDKELNNKVEVSNDINNSVPGNYTVKYKVKDSSNNETEATRGVTVKKPNVVVATPPKEEKVVVPKVEVTVYENTLKSNKFNSNNIYLEGYIKEPLEENKLRFVAGEDNIREIPITVTNNSYSVSINPEEIGNGTYKLYVNDEVLLNKMAEVIRLARAKVGSKLVTFTYNSQDEVTMVVENHGYSYDILINPGHGGEDTGAVNEYIREKEMNLTVSMYEKCRYEAHGLRVYMTRTSDVYGNNFGPSSLSKLHKVAYEMGYYGAVSKVVYSNHHNSIGNNYYSGYEVLIGGAFTGSELVVEKSIASRWNQIFDLTESHMRFYARDYDTEQKFSKLNGEVYSFKDNYAVNRIPYQTANVKSIIYEGCYMSNKNEFTWYWLNNNWVKVSEIKIEEYLKSLGVAYNPNNSEACL